MSTEVTIALITFIGTSIGTFGGIIASSKLTNHRIEQLEKKVEKHNNIVHRTYILEERMNNLEKHTIKG